MASGLGMRSIITIVAALSLVGSLAAPGGAYQRPVAFDRVDIAVDGSEVEEAPAANGNYNRHTAISSGRFVAFTTDESLDPMDVNELSDVYVRDVTSGVTELISRSSSGLPAAGPPDDPQQLDRLSSHPAISPDGRFIAFDSTAINLVPGDTNGMRDVFVFDRRKGVMERVSISSEGGQLEPEGVPLLNWSEKPSISRSGRYVSFTSNLDNLVEDDNNDGPDNFVHDRESGTNVRVSVDSAGNEVDTTCADICLPFDGLIGDSSISATGRYVAFDSFSPDLVEDDTNRTWDVFVRDLKKKTTERVSVASDGEEARDVFSTGREVISGSTLSGATTTKPGHSLSADGRFVTFVSQAGNLVPNHSNRTGKVPTSQGGQDVYVHDRETGRTERVSVDSNGAEFHKDLTALTAGSNVPSISASGRYVGFGCAPSCAQGEGPKGPAVHDRHSGALVEVQIEPGFAPTLAPSGRYLSLFNDDGRWRVDIGETLGVGGLGGDPPEPEPDESIICVEGICIPPGAAVSSFDTTDDFADGLTEQGANLYGASIAYRPQYEDLFAAIELEYMPRVLSGASPIFYGLRFEAGDKSYEVRATSLNFGTFGLFDCTEVSVCSKVNDLRGGYGTTGMRVVFSLPLKEIGLEDSGKLKDVEAFSAVGSLFTGAAKVLDRVTLR